jgi:serine/threonine protein kinase
MCCGRDWEWSILFDVWTLVCIQDDGRGLLWSGTYILKRWTPWSLCARIHLRCRVHTSKTHTHTTKCLDLTQERKKGGHGRYKEVRLLHKTVLGFVHLVVDTHTGLQVAIKTSYPKPHGHPSIESPLDEVAMYDHLARLESSTGQDNIISGVHYNYTDRLVQIIVPYYSGGDLFSLRVDHDLSLSTWSGLCRQVARGVGFLHCNNICHLDLSPENVFLDSNRICKIGDFGQARQVVRVGETAPLSTRSGRPGKWDYMAPEILASECYDGFAADVFSLGVSFFGMMTGAAMFHPTSSRRIQLERFRHLGVRACLLSWKMDEIAETGIGDLVDAMLRPEGTRITIQGVLDHPFMSEVNSTPFSPLSRKTHRLPRGC